MEKENEIVRSSLLVLGFISVNLRRISNVPFEAPFFHSTPNSFYASPIRTFSLFERARTVRRVVELENG